MNKYLVKIAGMPLAVGGALTGAFPLIGAVYGGVLGSKNKEHPLLAGIGGAVTGLTPPIGAAYGGILGYNSDRKVTEKKKEAK